MHTVTQRRITMARIKAARIKQMIDTAVKMRSEGKSNIEIARVLKVGESTARLLGWRD